MYIPNPANNIDKSGFGKTTQGMLTKTTTLNGQHHYRPTNNDAYKGFVFFAVYNQAFPNQLVQTQKQYGGILNRNDMPQYTKPRPY